ncbi:MAG: hypothetical protein PHF99_07110, partial [Bacteroidales bacterium]|jgi:hypothetical protein|nr:hypothetical protein [Bacteroidales bacterium]
MKKISLIILSIMIHFIIYAIDSPVNVSPINGATNQAVTILIDWNSVTGNSGYIYQIDTTPGFNSPILIEGETSLNSSQITVTSLCFNTTYYWHCATKTAVDTSIWSSTWSFTTANTISNISPSNGATNQ